MLPKHVRDEATTSAPPLLAKPTAERPPAQKDAASGIERVEDWFTRRNWQPFAFQREVWNAYLVGESGLVHSATGTGKTLAVWCGPIMEWLDSRPRTSVLRAADGALDYAASGAGHRYGRFAPGSGRRTATALRASMHGPVIRPPRSQRRRATYRPRLSRRRKACRYFSPMRIRSSSLRI